MTTDPAEATDARLLTAAFERIGAAMDAEARAGATAVAPIGSSLRNGRSQGRHIMQGLVAAAVVAILGLALVLASANRSELPADQASSPSVPPPGLVLSTRPGFVITAGPGDDGALCVSGGLPDQLGMGQVCTPPETLAVRPASSISDVGDGALQVVIVTAPGRQMQVSFDGEVWTTVDTDDDGVVIEQVDDPVSAVAYGFEVQEGGVMGDADQFSARYIGD